MRIRPFILTLALLSFATCAFAEVKPASVVMSGAFAKAKAEKKTVLLSFHASWCGWCHKFEDFIKREDIKPIWEKRFVMVWLTVLENGEKKKDENPGGADWLKKTGGDKGGIPFIALFNGNGDMKINSNRPADKAKEKDAGGNIGYPAAPEEIAWFMVMLEKAAPNVTANERATIEAALREEAKKIGR